MINIIQLNLHSGLVSLLAIAAFYFSGCQTNNPEISVVAPDNATQSVQHAIDMLESRLTDHAVSHEVVNEMAEARGARLLVIADEDSDSELLSLPESFSVKSARFNEKSGWRINGSDNRGLMYGLQEVAERVSWADDNQDPFSKLEDMVVSPDVRTRAISMYTMNRSYWESRFYDEAYWNRYFSLLARNRFNTVKLIFGYENGGFLAPVYPYFFNVSGYPQIRMENISQEQQEKNLAALNRLVDLAHAHGLDFEVAIWDHIYRGGVQDGGLTREEVENQPPFQVRGVTAENLSAYTMAALTKFMESVPELDGIQFRMHNESGLEEGAEMLAFWTDVFGMLKRVNPDLKVELRAKDLPETIIRLAIDQDLNFTLTTKYWMEQMGLPFHPTHINRENQFDRRHGYADMLRYPKEYSVHWRLWSGGTQRILLWGDPEFARRFAESTHLYEGDGFEVNEPLATKMETKPHDAEPFDLLAPRYVYYDYEFERYWHFFQSFGLVGYNPDVSPAHWKAEFESRFGTSAAVVENALHKASWILPTIVAACAPYGTFPTTRGWPERQMYGTLPAYADAEGSDIQQFASFDEEAAILLGEGETAKQLPSETSRWFKKQHDEIQGLIRRAEELQGDAENKELVSTLTDLSILSKLALYHARRIPAAVNYRIYERTGSRAALEEAIRYEKSAFEAWKEIVEAAGDVYTDDLAMGIRASVFMDVDHHMAGHWRDEVPYFENEIESLDSLLNTLPYDGPDDAPIYQPASDTTDRQRFEFSHEPVKRHPANEPMEIIATVRSTNDLEWVRLRFRAVNQHDDYKTLQMEPVGNDQYKVTIPASEIETRFDFMYFFELMDKKGHGTIYPDYLEETPYIITHLER